MEFVNLEIRMGGCEPIWLRIYGQMVGSCDNGNEPSGFILLWEVLELLSGK
jgi:hypothetical protein